MRSVHILRVARWVGGWRWSWQAHPPLSTMQIGVRASRAKRHTISSRSRTPAADTAMCPSGSPTRMSVPEREMRLSDQAWSARSRTSAVSCSMLTT